MKSSSAFLYGAIGLGVMVLLGFGFLVSLVGQAAQIASTSNTQDTWCSNSVVSQPGTVRPPH